MLIRYNAPQPYWYAPATSMQLRYSYHNGRFTPLYSLAEYEPVQPSQPLVVSRIIVINSLGLRLAMYTTTVYYSSTLQQYTTAVQHHNSANSFNSSSSSSRGTKLQKLFLFKVQTQSSSLYILYIFLLLLLLYCYHHTVQLLLLLFIYNNIIL